MPDETTTGQDAGQNNSTTTQTETGGSEEKKTFDAEYVKKLRDELAARRVSERDALKKLTEYEAASKTTEENKLKEQNEFKALYEKEKAAREKAEADHAALALSALKSKVASDAGLPAPLADRLKGTTEDELKADAKELLKTIPAQQQGGQRGSTTAAYPGGKPVNETDDQKRQRLFGRGRNAFSKRE